jgi:tRNA-Thr(GGU) m(6)t(6)A37 methyltransferase TsaA
MAMQKNLSDIQKLKRLLPYWLSHNAEHLLDYEKWRSKAESTGLSHVGFELKAVVELSKEANRHMERACALMEGENATESVEKPGKGKDGAPGGEIIRPDERGADYPLRSIGVIRTPYVDHAPYQPVTEDEGEFRICVDPVYADGLKDLDRFRYIYVIYFVHRVRRKVSMSVSPHWTPGSKVGLFASRSPVRPNRLGLSVVQLRRISGNEIFTSGLDVFDGTPLLDIKPYIQELDSKSDANFGWLEDFDDREHLMLHIKGIPHDY